MKKRKERIDRGIKARSSDVFALCSWREMLYLAAPRCIPILVLFVLSLTLNIYWQKVLLSVAVFALLAMSWDFLGQSGMVSLGQSLFFGIGAYAFGILQIKLGISLLPEMCYGLARTFLRSMPIRLSSLLRLATMSKWDN